MRALSAPFFPRVGDEGFSLLVDFSPSGDGEVSFLPVFRQSFAATTSIIAAF